MISHKLIRDESSARRVALYMVINNAERNNEPPKILKMDDCPRKPLTQHNYLSHAYVIK